MQPAWLVIRTEKHIDPRYWVCLDRADALVIAKEVADYWIAEYGTSADENDPHGMDRTCYGDEIFHCDGYDSFDVQVIPTLIRGPGEVDQIPEEPA